MSTLLPPTEITVPSTLISHTDLNTKQRGVTIIIASDPRRILYPDPHTVILRNNPRRRRCRRHQNKRHYYNHGTLIDRIINPCERQLLTLVHEWILACGHASADDHTPVLVTAEMLTELSRFMRHHGEEEVVERLRHATDVLAHHPVASVWYCPGR